MSEKQQPAHDLAESCVRHVEAAVGVRLDYTQETLPVLDYYLRGLPAEPDASLVELVTCTCGAYFGEVVRKHLPGARWHAPDDTYRKWRIEFDPFFLHFNPLGMALEALHQQETRGWAAHLHLLDEDRGLVRDVLSRMGSVREEDFYRFSIRFEVIENVHATLTHQSANEQASRRFPPEAYAVVADLPEASAPLN